MAHDQRSNSSTAATWRQEAEYPHARAVAAEETRHRTRAVQSLATTRARLLAWWHAGLFCILTPTATRGGKEGAQARYNKRRHTDFTPLLTTQGASSRPTSSQEQCARARANAAHGSFFVCVRLIEYEKGWVVWQWSICPALACVCLASARRGHQS
jgi:hypothetical protein